MTGRAAIIGLGRWGRSLVNAVHGKTDAIKFVAAYTRTRASAEEFCRERGIPMLARFEDALASRDIDAAPPHAPYPMKGVGPFTHTNVHDRPPMIFGGKNTLHFGGEFAPYVLLPVIPK